MTPSVLPPRPFTFSIPGKQWTGVVAMSCSDGTVFVSHVPEQLLPPHSRSHRLSSITHHHPTIPKSVSFARLSSWQPSPIAPSGHHHFRSQFSSGNAQTPSLLSSSSAKAVSTVEDSDISDKHSFDYSSFRVWGWSRVDTVRVLVGSAWMCPPTSLVGGPVRSSTHVAKPGSLTQSNGHTVEPTAIWTVVTAKESGLRMYRYAPICSRLCIWELLWALETPFTNVAIQCETGMCAICPTWSNSVAFFSFRSSLLRRNSPLHSNQLSGTANADAQTCGAGEEHPLATEALMGSDLYFRLQRCASTWVPQTADEETTGLVHDRLDGGVDVVASPFIPGIRMSSDCEACCKSFSSRVNDLAPLGLHRWVAIRHSTIYLLKTCDLEEEHAKRIESHLARAATPFAVGITSVVTLNGHRYKIYLSAFDGFNRLATVDCSETLIVWDTSKNSKLFGLDLRAPDLANSFLSKSNFRSEDESCSSDDEATPPRRFSSERPDMQSLQSSSPSWHPRVDLKIVAPPKRKQKKVYRPSVEVGLDRTPKAVTPPGDSTGWPAVSPNLTKLPGEPSTVDFPYDNTNDPTAGGLRLSATADEPNLPTAVTPPVRSWAQRAVAHQLQSAKENIDSSNCHKSETGRAGRRKSLPKISGFSLTPNDHEIHSLPLELQLQIAIDRSRDCDDGEATSAAPFDATPSDVLKERRRNSVRDSAAATHASNGGAENHVDLADKQSKFLDDFILSGEDLSDGGIAQQIELFESFAAAKSDDTPNLTRRPRSLRVQRDMYGLLPPPTGNVDDVEDAYTANSKRKNLYVTLNRQRTAGTTANSQSRSIAHLEIHPDTLSLLYKDLHVIQTWRF